MKYKKSTLITLSVIVLLSFLGFGCNKSNTASVKIGFLIPNFQIGRYVKEKDVFVKIAKEMGAEPIYADANNDDQLQIQQAMDMLRDGVEVLLVNSINANTAALIVREAHANNAKVIAYDRLIQNSEVDYYLSFNNQKVGSLMAEYVVKKQPVGSFVLLNGDKADKNAVFVREGIMQVLDPIVKSGKIKIQYDVFIEDWSEINAYEEMKKVVNLGNTNPDAALTSYDGLANGAIRVLTENKIEGKVMVTGQDAELSAIHRIISGTQSMTVYKSVTKLAETGTKLAIQLARNQKIDLVTTSVFNGRIQVPSVLLDPVSVDVSNIKTTVIADGYYTEKEVYTIKE